MKPVRFLLAGGLNTVITYLIYLALLHVMDYALAFTLTFLMGIALGYLLNLLFVFQSSATQTNLLGYPVLYLINYLAGLGLMAGLVELVGVRREIAPLISTAVLTPFMFFLSKKLFAPTSTESPR